MTLHILGYAQNHKEDQAVSTGTHSHTHTRTHTHTHTHTRSEHYQCW